MSSSSSSQIVSPNISVTPGRRFALSGGALLLVCGLLLLLSDGFQWPNVRLFLQFLQQYQNQQPNISLGLLIVIAIQLLFIASAWICLLVAFFQEVALLFKSEGAAEKAKPTGPLLLNMPTPTPHQLTTQPQLPAIPQQAWSTSFASIPATALDEQTILPGQFQPANSSQQPTMLPVYQVTEEPKRNFAPPPPPPEPEFPIVAEVAASIPLDHLRFTTTTDEMPRSYENPFDGNREEPKEPAPPTRRKPVKSKTPVKLDSGKAPPVEPFVMPDDDDFFSASEEPTIIPTSSHKATRLTGYMSEPEEEYEQPPLPKKRPVRSEPIPLEPEEQTVTYANPFDGTEIIPAQEGPLASSENNAMLPHEEAEDGFIFGNPFEGAALPDIFRMDEELRKSIGHENAARPGKRQSRDTAVSSNDQIIQVGVVAQGKKLDEVNEQHITHLVVSTSRMAATGFPLSAGLFVVIDDSQTQQEDDHYASELALEYIQEEIIPLLSDPNQTAEDLKTSFVEVLKQVNRQLFAENKSTHILHKAALTGALVVQDTPVLSNKHTGTSTHIAYVVNVGDGRTYWQSSARGFNRVARQQADLPDQNDKKTTRRFTASGNLKSGLSPALGERPELDVDVFTLPLQGNDRLLLSSHALWKVVREPVMASLIAVPVKNPSQITSLLQQATLASGGQENMTAIVVLVPGA